MATERVKVYEEKSKATPIWYWLLPLIALLLLALWAWNQRHHAPIATTNTPAAVGASSTAGALPVLGTVHFDTDKATLTPDGQATLARAADVMKQTPNLHLRLEGYTDSSGSVGLNDALAQQRALTVQQFLIAKGIPTDRLTGQGFGPANPVNTNSTSTGKADNRRVELFQQP